MFTRLLKAATHRLNNGVANASLGNYCDTMEELLKAALESPTDEECRSEVQLMLRVLGPLVAGNTFSATPNRSAIQEDMLQRREMIFWYCQTCADSDMHDALALHVQFMSSGKNDARKAIQEWAQEFSIHNLANYPRFCRLRKELCNLADYNPETDPLRHHRPASN